MICVHRGQASRAAHFASGHGGVYGLSVAGGVRPGYVWTGLALLVRPVEQVPGAQGAAPTGRRIGFSSAAVWLCQRTARPRNSQAQCRKSARCDDDWR